LRAVAQPELAEHSRDVCLDGVLAEDQPVGDLGVGEAARGEPDPRLAVTLRLGGEREGLPAPAVEAACHVVQEGLTNALRYAAGADVDVLVRGERDALVVTVENAAAPHDPVLEGLGTGTGLQGLRERVGAAGGRLEAGPAPGGGWRLAASLPRRVAIAV
jgi:signal transduction histidine kinase